MDAHDLALAYSLSAISGLRAALTMLAVTVAVHLHVFEPPAPLSWLGSDTTLLIVGLFVIADFFGDKVPIVDHALHLVHTVLAPVAGGIAASSVDPSNGTVAVAGLLGAANALGVHSVKSAVRVGTSAVSLGVLTPVISIVEDVIAAVALLAAFLAPIAMAIVTIVATIFAIATGRRLWRWLAHRRSQPLA